MTSGKRDFLSLADYTRTELGALLDHASRLKKGEARGTPLQGKSLAMIFRKSSTRTRVSFEVGMTQLGGHALFLSDRDSQMGRGESLHDTARVRQPTDKGRVERAVPTVRDDCFGGERLYDIAQARAHAHTWCRSEYGVRRHTRTQRLPLEHFETEEQPALPAAPPGPARRPGPPAAGAPGALPAPAAATAAIRVSAVTVVITAAVTCARRAGRTAAAGTAGVPAPASFRFVTEPAAPAPIPPDWTTETPPRGCGRGFACDSWATPCTRAGKTSTHSASSNIGAVACSQERCRWSPQP